MLPLSAESALITEEDLEERTELGEFDLPNLVFRFQSRALSSSAMKSSFWFGCGLHGGMSKTVGMSAALGLRASHEAKRILTESGLLDKSIMVSSMEIWKNAYCVLLAKA